jgi:hypothetical protein
MKVLLFFVAVFYVSMLAWIRLVSRLTWTPIVKKLLMSVLLVFSLVYSVIGIIGQQVNNVNAWYWAYIGNGLILVYLVILIRYTYINWPRK